MVEEYLALPDMGKHLILRNLNQKELKYKIYALDMSISRTLYGGWTLLVIEPNSVTATHFLISGKKQSNFAVSLMTLSPLTDQHLGKTVYLQLLFSVSTSIISN